MAGPCMPAFEHLAQELGGFSCAGAHPVINVHNPLALRNPTLLVIEAVMIAGAALSLTHAIRRRRAGDPTPLALWLSALVYLAVIEPPLYFPDLFGIEGRVGLIFVHDEFTVQFLYDRLPLYIVALYPAMVVLAYELVRAAGVFERWGVVVSSMCVGFVHQCLYEIFDHLGPQLRWWIWNPGADTNVPSLGSVPVSSMVLFGTVGPFALTLLVRIFVTRHAGAAGSISTGALVARSAGVGVLVPLGLGIGGIPSSLFGTGETANRAGQAVALSIELAVFAVVGIVALVGARHHRAPAENGDRYALAHGALYLVVLAGLWLVALPDYLGARDGITGDGTPTGSLPYALACFAASLAFLGLAFGRRSRAGEQAPAGDAALIS